jgi:hypothetical protein
MRGVLRGELWSLAKLLVLVGGLVLLIYGILGVLSGGVSVFAESLLNGAGRIGEGAVKIVIGLIALLAYRFLKSLAWTIVVLILGIVAGGLGGILMLIGGIIALVAHFVRM